MYALVKAKQDLDFNNNLVQLIDVIKGIASAQYRVMEKQREYFGTYLNAFEDFFSMINLFDVHHPYIKSESPVAGIVMVTSDAGFMGGLNTRVIELALDVFKDREKHLIVLGERGADYLRDMGLNFKFFPGVAEREKRDEQIEQLKKYLTEIVNKKEVGSISISYPRSISFTVQKVEIVEVLPFDKAFQHKERKPLEKKVILESKEEKILEYLVEVWITYKLYEVFEDSKLSEFSARTIHLEQSYQDLSRFNRLLRFKYFRSHHEVIDKSMRETFASRLLAKRARNL